MRDQVLPTGIEGSTAPWQVPQTGPPAPAPPPELSAQSPAGPAPYSRLTAPAVHGAQAGGVSFPAIRPGTRPGGVPAAGTPARRLYDSLGSEAATAFIRLTATEQRQVAEIDAMSTGEARLALNAMLGDRKLLQRDGEGRTLLQNLAAFLQTPLTVPLGSDAAGYRQEQLSVIVGHVHQPRAIFQGNHGTCGVTVGQKLLAGHSPADYVRLATGLLSAAGEARLPDGSTIRVVPDSLRAHSWDQRPAVSRVMQAALMDWASAGRYSNADDRFHVDVPLVGDVRLSQGTGGIMADRLMTALTGRRLEVLARPNLAIDQDGFAGNLHDLNGAQILKAVEQDLQHQARTSRRASDRHDQPQVWAGIRWVDTNHAIGVTRVTPTRVHFSNPLGDAFARHRLKPDGEPRALQVDPETGMRYYEYGSADTPPRRLYEDGTESLGRADFEERLHVAVVSDGAARQAHRQQRFEF